MTSPALRPSFNISANYGSTCLCWELTWGPLVTSGSPPQPLPSTPVGTFWSPWGRSGERVLAGLPWVAPTFPGQNCAQFHGSPLHRDHRGCKKRLIASITPKTHFLLRGISRHRQTTNYN